MDSGYFSIDHAQETRVDLYKRASTEKRPGLVSARDLNQLEDLAEKKHPAVETAIKCKAFFMKSLIVLDLNISKKDIDEINRTQEHLFTSYGSFEKDQIRELKKLIGEKKGFQQLKKELNSYKPAESLRLKILTAPLASLMVSCPTDSGRKTLTKKYIKAVADNRAHSMQIAVKKLSKGESVLIDGHVLRFKGPAMKPSGGHAMVMRITRNHNNTYNMEFVNTGIGITRNSEFHPKSKTVENEYQTVALIQNISPKKLFKNHFFETFSSVASGGKIPTFSCIPKEQLGHAKGLATQGENSNLENQIDLMYLCMRQLGKPVQMEEGSSYYTQAQLGGSCSVSSLWAVSQIVLSKEEVKILKTDAKLKSLIRNYKKIQNGYDQSSTRKLMVLDQVQSLKQHYMHDQNAQKILNKTELDLLSDLKINRVEIKTSSKGKVSLKQFLEPIKGKPGEFTLKPMQATLNFQTKRLKVDVDWEPVNGKDSFATSISYDVKQDPENPNRYIGKTQVDSLYLLYFSLANADQEATSDYLLQVMNNPKKDRPFKTGETDELLVNLLNVLGNSNLRSDIAKKYCILLLLKDCKTYQLDKLLEHMRSTYLGMEVEGHLTEDNIWVKAINQLKSSS